jgi:transposase-like protein
MLRNWELFDKQNKNESPRVWWRLQLLRRWSHYEGQQIYPELRERAVRMVLEHRADHSSQWATVESIAPKIGCTAQTLLKWIQRAEIDQGTRDGVTTAERERVTALEREVKELRRANEILKLASAFFAQAELDRRFKA